MSPKTKKKKPTNDDVLDGIGPKLQQCRIAKGWSRETLAQMTDVHYDTIRKLEVGDRSPNLVTLVALANAFGVHVTDLLQ